MEAALARRRSLPDREPVYVGACIFLGIAGVISAMLTLTSLNLTWLQILIAPKIYLIEYAASLAK